jgi:hypothetical protein
MRNQSDKRPEPDPLPESFATLQEAGEFWDTHSSAEYEIEMEETDLEVRARRSDTGHCADQASIDTGS